MGRSADLTVADVSLIPIPQENVSQVWHLGAEFIETGLKQGEFTADILKAECESGKAQLWFAWADHLEAAAVTQLMATPRGLKCVITSLGGKDSFRWLGYLDELELYAKTQGCNGMRIYGRKGWARKLRDYRITRLILDKDL